MSGKKHYVELFAHETVGYVELNEYFKPTEEEKEEIHLVKVYFDRCDEFDDKLEQRTDLHPHEALKRMQHHAHCVSEELACHLDISGEQFRRLVCRHKRMDPRRKR